VDRSRALADVGEENDLLGEQFVSRGRPNYSKGQAGRESAYVTRESTTKVAYVHSLTFRWWDFFRENDLILFFVTLVTCKFGCFVFWDPCCPLKIIRRIGRKYHLHLQGVQIRKKPEWSMYHVTRGYMREDRTLHNYRCQILKPYSYTRNSVVKILHIVTCIGWLRHGLDW
jgi:hypothetical protein